MDSVAELVDDIRVQRALGFFREARVGHFSGDQCRLTWELKPGEDKFQQVFVVLPITAADYCPTEIMMHEDTTYAGGYRDMVLGLKGGVSAPSAAIVGFHEAYHAWLDLKSGRDRAAYWGQSAPALQDSALKEEIAMFGFDYTVMNQMTNGQYGNLIQQELDKYQGEMLRHWPDSILRLQETSEMSELFGVRTWADQKNMLTHARTHIYFKFCDAQGFGFEGKKIYFENQLFQRQKKALEEMAQ